MMSVVYYKNIGATNTFIGEATSFLYLPWTLKFLWSPFVDIYGTKRKWVLVAQAVLGCIALLLVGSVFLPDGIFISVVIFFVMALASATQDVAIDGYYLDVLNKEQQSFYVGVRNAFYKVAVLAGSGGLVYLAGTLAESANFGVKGAWAVAFAVCAGLMLACSAFHAFALPEPARPEAEVAVGVDGTDSTDSTDSTDGTDGTTDADAANARAKPAVPNVLSPREFLSVLTTWLNQPRIAVIITYIFIFRLGDALMLKMAQPFLLDSVDKGGLAITTADVGIIYGTVGVLFLLAGGIIGGALVSKLGLKKCLMPTALIQNGAILLYWWLAMAKPSGPVSIMGISLMDIASKVTANQDVLRWFDAKLFSTIMVNSAEQFSYGLGTAAYTVFLLSTVKSDFKAAHYAIATAIMAFGMMIPGYLSGRLTDHFGYQTFFLISFLASLPGILSILGLPLDKTDNEVTVK